LGTLEPEKVKEIASNITTASKNMLELVNDLLDVAKLESGKFDLNIQEYDLANIIREQVQTYKAQAEQKHIQLNLSAPEKLVVKCDRVRVGQVLQNLLSNAIKYTEAGEVLVTLTTELDRNRVTVSVKDTGIGVGRDELPQLFSKFRQLKTAESARKGTGLGLAVSKGLVEAHGGQIWAESAGENMGSIFYFSLPLDMKAS
jgi:signal transduction histidine kinase